MEEEERLEQRIRLIATVKRNCLLCNAHRNFDSQRGEREKVLSLLEKLRDLYEEEYNLLRAKNADAELIRKANTKRRCCINAIEKCTHCDREIDIVNRLFPSI